MSEEIPARKFLQGASRPPWHSQGKGGGVRCHCCGSGHQW